MTDIIPIDTTVLDGQQALADEDRSLVLEGAQLLVESSQAISTAIHQTRSPVNNLLAKSNQVQEALDNCRGLTAPIRRLHPELLQKIFLAVDVPHKRARHPPVASTICRYWRELALATPRLWTNIRLQFHSQCEGNIRRFVSWAERSADLPLSLTIEQHTHMVDDFTVEVVFENATIWPTAGQPGRDLADAIQPFSHRLEYLRLNNDSATFAFALQTWKESATFLLPNLKTLISVRLPDCHAPLKYLDGSKLAKSRRRLGLDDTSVLLQSVLQNSPRLENLLLACRTKVVPPWRTLQTFCGSGHLISLTSAPNLRVLRLFRPNSMATYRPIEGDCAFESLTSLWISDIPRLLEESSPFPTLPALRHLILQKPREEEKCTALLTAWGAGLQFFGINNDAKVQVSPKGLTTKNCPNLEALRLCSRQLQVLVEASPKVDLPQHVEFTRSKERNITSMVSDMLDVLLDNIRRKGLSVNNTGGQLKTLCFRANELEWEAWEPSAREAKIRAFSELGIRLDVYICRGMGGFDGPYFEQQGGIMDELYSERGWSKGSVFDYMDL